MTTPKLPNAVRIVEMGPRDGLLDEGRPEGIDIARAGHAVHGTTRQVLSLITNPIDVICANLKNVRAKMDERPDVLGAHLSPYCYPYVIEHIADGTLKTAGVVTKTFPIEQWAEAFDHADGKYGDFKVAITF